jgi:decaprenylphospho-beta-D-ribofuranose 2-oxidase
VFRATAGGMGLTGVIVQAGLQLLPVESAWMRVDTFRTRDLDDTIAQMASTDAHYRYAVAWLDLAPGSRHFGRGVLTNADHAARHELPRKRLDDSLDPKGREALSVPDIVPSGLLRHGMIRTLNAAWFRLSRPGRTLQPVLKYFFPLDRLAEWNRAYGRRGFVQYQVVVPDAGTVREVVARLRAARAPVALAVLKRLGASEGHLSFPMRGWTLAVDIPIGGDDLPDLLDRCAELVAAAGGRV